VCGSTGNKQMNFDAVFLADVPSVLAQCYVDSDPQLLFIKISNEKIGL